MADPRSMDCPSCGAPLQIQEGQSIVICKFCRDTIRLDMPRAAPVPPPAPSAPPPVVVVTSTPRAPRPAPQAQKQSGLAGCGCSAVFVAGMLLFVGGVLLFSGAIPLPGALRLSLQNVVPLNMLVFEGVALSPSTNDTLPELMGLAQNNSAGELDRMMVKIDAEGQLAWQAQPFTESSVYIHPSHIVAAGSAVYVALDDTLYAYQLSDGASLWQASLTDAPHPSCQQCIQVHGEHVVVLAGDGTLHGFNTANGDAEWTYTLPDSTYYLFDFADQPVVIEREDTNGTLLFFDSATGAITRRLQPICTHSSGSFDETIYEYDAVFLYDPASRALFLAYGSSEGCVQRWDLAADTNDPEWSAHLTYEDGFNGSYDQTFLLDAGTLYLSSLGGYIRAFDAQTGEWREVVREDDAETTLLGVQDGVALLQVTSARGTRKYALWGVDAASGDVLWRYSLDEAEPLTQVGDSSGAVFEDAIKWTWRLMSGRVQLVRVEGKPQQLSLQSLNLRDGAQSQTITMPLTRLDTSSYTASYIGWRGSRMWLWIDYDLYRLNTETGEIEFVWP